MQDLRLLDVQEVHTFSNVEGHFERLLHVELYRFFLMKQGEKRSSETKLG